MNEKLPTGAPVLDELLDGGYEKDVVTMIYGPAGSGKTTTCLLASLVAARSYKVIFIDTEGGFSAERLHQLSKKGNTKNIMLLTPTTFAEQQKQIEKLNRLITPEVGLIVCDTVSALYRTERGEDNQALNREMARQLGLLLEIARKKNIPIILTNQVYSDFDNKNAVKLVGGDIMLYNSKCLIELQNAAKGHRTAVLRKHRNLPERKAVFRITEAGFDAV